VLGISIPRLSAHAPTGTPALAEDAQQQQEQQEEAVKAGGGELKSDHKGWAECDPRSVHDILRDQVSDFATGMARVAVSCPCAGV
jgi:hypothetical protein